MDEGRRALLFGGLALAIALAWANGLRGPFVYDDFVEVAGNRTIHFLEEWRTILAYNWSRPITILSFAVGWRLWGAEVLPHHLVNVAIHMANAALAALVGLELFKDKERKEELAFGAALLWALHPLQTESVTYITGRSEALVSSFYLGGCLLWLRGSPWAWACAAGAVFTKEVGATLPLAFLLLDHVRGPVPWRRHWPGALGILAFLALRWKLYGTPLTPGEALRPLDVQLLTQAEVIPQYLRLAVIPWNQTIFHDHPEADWGILSVGGGLALLVGLGLSLRYRWLALPWFLLLLAPSSSFVPLRETMAEHRVYLALLGLAWAVVPRLPRPAIPAIALVFGGLTALRNQVWKSEVGLWEEAASLRPDSDEAWYGVGDARHRAGKHLDALHAFEEATGLNESYLDAWNNLGREQAELGREDEAEATWKATLRRSPTYCKAHNNLGLLYARNDDPRQAAAELRTSLAWCPEDCFAHRMLGYLYADQLADRTKAVQHLEIYLELCPTERESAAAREKLTKLTW